MGDEPVACQDGNFGQGTWLFKQMRSARHHLQAMLATQHLAGQAIQLQDLHVPATDDLQGWGLHTT